MVTEYRLISKKEIFTETAFVISAENFPSLPSFLSNHAYCFISGQRLSTSISMAFDSRIFLRRNNRLNLKFFKNFIDFPLIKSAISIKSFQIRHRVILQQVLGSIGIM